MLVELPVHRITAAPEVPVGTNEGSVPANTALPYCAPWGFGGCQNGNGNQIKDDGNMEGVTI